MRHDWGILLCEQASVIRPEIGRETQLGSNGLIILVSQYRAD